MNFLSGGNHPLHEFGHMFVAQTWVSMIRANAGTPLPPFLSNLAAQNHLGQFWCIQSVASNESMKGRYWAVLQLRNDNWD